MGARKVSSSGEPSPKRRPASTPEAREQQMVGYAIDLAEKQLREGTASSQVITHFLKLGTCAYKTEREILEKQSQLLDAKVEVLKSQKNMEEVYVKAIEAMKRYSGVQDDSEEF